MMLAVVLVAVLAAQEPPEKPVSIERACRESLVQLDALREELEAKSKLITKDEAQIELERSRGDLYRDAAQARAEEIAALKSAIEAIEKIVTSLEKSLAESEKKRARAEKLKWVWGLAGALAGAWVGSR